MNRKFKNALKSAFSIPEPQRKDDFFQSIEENKKAVPFWIPLLKYGAVTAAAAIAIIISSNFTDISNVKEQYVEEAPAVTCVTDENVFDAEELVPENNNPVTVTSSHTHSENLAADSETLTTAPVTAPSNIQTEIHTGITTAVTSSAQTTVSGENSSVTAAATITTATTITTASASKTTPTRAGTYTTVNSVSTAKRTTTSAIPTDPAPSTYTTMPTMTTPSYEPSYTMTTSGPMVDEPSDIGIDYTVYPDSSFYITDNIIDVSEYINFEYSPSPDDNISSELETWQYDALRSDENVFGIVMNKYYTSLDGLPYIQLDILIEEPLKHGELSYGDIISVYVPGEFMPLRDFIDEYNCANLFEDMTETEIAETTAYFPWADMLNYYCGMELLFFISKNSGSVPYGAYRLSSDSIYSLYYRNEDNFSCPDSYISFTIDEYNEFMGY